MVCQGCGNERRFSCDKCYQVVKLHLTDGRVIKATVPAFCNTGESVSVQSVELTQPIKMQEGYSWSEATIAEVGDAE